MQGSELVIVSGYDGLIHSIREVCGEVGIAPATLEWERADLGLVQALGDLFVRNGRPDVIISRGAVAHVIESAFLDIVVLRAEPDDVDLVEVLSAAAKEHDRIGFLIYEPHAFAFKTESLKTILGLESLRAYPVRSKEDIQSVIAQGRRDGMQAMVGGGKLGRRTGQALGFPVYFVETGRRSIRNAISQAVAIIEARKGEKRRLESLKTVVDAVQEGIMTVRGEEVVLINPIFAAMLRLPPDVMPENGGSLTVARCGPALQRFIASVSSEEILHLGEDVLLCRKVSLPGQEEIMVICRDVTDIQKQERKIRRELHAKGLTARYRFTDILGRSSAIRSAVDKARTYAETDATVLIHGASGTGKELFAQSIHNGSRRRNKPFVAVNCAAIPETLLESELFGYEEGAFSGARRSGNPGLFELAHEGTIFLDEINSLPVALQGVLLRVIQEKQIRRVGSRSIISVDARIISATNSDIPRLIAKGLFRADLYYRLDTLNLGIPSLARRPEDIPLLCEHFLERYAARYAMTPPALSVADAALLATHPWQGNVRELENVIHRFVVRLRSGENRRLSLRECLDAGFCQPEEPIPADDATICVNKGTLADIEQQVIRRYLEETRWNRQAAAERLGLSRATLWRKLRQAGLEWR